MTFEAFAKIAKSLMTPGRKIIIGLERGGVKHEKTVELRRLL